jgi:hypothetical protein
MRRRPRRAWAWLGSVVRRDSTLFAHWTIGALPGGWAVSRMGREAHSNGLRCAICGRWFVTPMISSCSATPGSGPNKPASGLRRSWHRPGCTCTPTRPGSSPSPKAGTALTSWASTTAWWSPGGGGPLVPQPEGVRPTHRPSSRVRSRAGGNVSIRPSESATEAPFRAHPDGRAGCPILPFTDPWRPIEDVPLAVEVRW